VGERQASAFGAIVRNKNLHPAYIPGELPGNGEERRRLASGDRSARVPLELVATAKPEFAAHRHEPAPQPLLVGQGIPQFLSRGPEAARQPHGMGRTAIMLRRANPTLDGFEMFCCIKVQSDPPDPQRQFTVPTPTNVGDIETQKVSEALYASSIG